MIGGQFVGFFDQDFPFRGRERRWKEKAFRSIVRIGETGQILRFLDVELWFQNRFAFALTLQMERHEAVHRFAHLLVVIVGRLEEFVAQIFFRTKQLEDRFGPRHALFCFSGAELNAIFRRIDYQKSTRGNQAKNIAFFGELQAQWAALRRRNILSSDRPDNCPPNKPAQPH